MADHVAGCIINDTQIVGGSAFLPCQRQQCCKTQWQKEVVSIEVCNEVAAC